MINISESFTTGIPAGFAVAGSIEDASTPSVVFNATEGAVDLSYVTANKHQQWRLGLSNALATQLGLSDFDLTVDLEVLPGGSGELHVGWHFRTGNGFETYQLAHYHYNAAPYASEWSGAYHAPSAGVWDNARVVMTEFTNRPMVSGVRYSIRAIRDNTGLIRIYLDGSLIGKTAAVPAATNLFPCLMFSNTNLRVHAVMLTSSFEDPTTKTVGMGLAWANSETRGQAWPGEIAAKPVPKLAPALLWRATEPVLPVDSKLTLGFIRGTITSRSEAVGGRRVVCFGPSLDPVAETVSAADGSYRFDLLWLGRESLIMAMDNPSFQYNPAAADRRKPEVYS